MRLLDIVACLSFLQPIICQQIFDMWSTTWDRSELLTYTNLSPNPINFVAPGVIGSADIVVDETRTFQNVTGFGGTLTDSSALLLNNLKNQNSANYQTLLNYLFDPTDGANSAGMSYVRVPLGSSDFSAKTYSFDDVNGDTSFANFNINAAPSYLFSVLKDIQSINPILKVHILPWSPPGWMKDSGSMNGGTLLPQFATQYATYLLKALQGFKANGITSLYAISIQNEPQSNNPTYPTALMPVDIEGQIGTALRPLMDKNGFSNISLIGYEHNWDNAAQYPVSLMQNYSSAFDGIAFHCYAGDVENQNTFHNQFPTKTVYLTECAGTIGSDWWEDIKWYTSNIFTGSVSYSAQAALMWAIALDGNGNPKLPGTNSCGGPGCRGMVQINNDGTYSVNQEFYSAGQASKATLPRDVGGPFGKRIGVSIGGALNWTLVVGAYITGRVSSTDWDRYSIVVLNCDDSNNGFSPTGVDATIEFRGMQARYTFPVGVTTMWWYAPGNGAAATIANVTTFATLTNTTFAHVNSTNATATNISAWAHNATNFTP